MGKKKTSVQQTQSGLQVKHFKAIDISKKYGFSSKNKNRIKNFDFGEYMFYRHFIIGHENGGILNELNGLNSQKNVWLSLTKRLKPNKSRIAFFKKLMHGIPNGNELRSLFNLEFKKFWKNLRDEEIEIDFGGESISLSTYLCFLLFEEFKKIYFFRVFCRVIENTVFFDLKVKPPKRAEAIILEIADAQITEIKASMSSFLLEFFDYKAFTARIAVGDPKQVQKMIDELTPNRKKIKFYCESKNFEKGKTLPHIERYNLIKLIKDIKYPVSEFRVNHEGESDLKLINKELNELGYSGRQPKFG